MNGEFFAFAGIFQVLVVIIVLSLLAVIIPYIIKKFFVKKLKSEATATTAETATTETAAMATMAATAATARYCECGHALSPEDDFCPKCGRRVVRG